MRTWITDRFRHSHRPEDQRHIILDLDETLVHSFSGYDVLRELKLFTSPRHIGLRARIFVLPDDIWGIARPHAETFLRACFDNFATVGVWSAGEDDYVRDVVTRVFRSLPKPDVVMTRDNCLDDGEIFTKPLSVARAYYEQVGRHDVVMNEGNTLIIEDRPSAVLPEDRFNSVFVPPYEPEARLSSLLLDDGTLKTMAGWIADQTFRGCSDVRMVPRPVFYRESAPRVALRAGYICAPRRDETPETQWAEARRRGGNAKEANLAQ